MFGESRVVALCTSRIYDIQVHSFIVELNELLKENGCILWIYALNEDLYWDEEKNPAEASVFDHISYMFVDTVMIMDEKIKSHKLAQRIISRARMFDKPVVVLDGAYEGCGNVKFDFAKGFEKAVRHVIEEHGVRKPVFMAGYRDNPFSEERLEVFKKVIGENGIEFSQDMVCYGDFWAKPARAAMKKLIDDNRVPEAVICANDIMAINVVDVLKKNGYSVPGDVIVSGFDGYEEAFSSVPGIMTVDCELSQMARAAVEAVLNCVNGEAKPETVVVPRLVPNESCGCQRYMENRDSTISRMNDSFYRYQDDIRLMHECITKMTISSDLYEALGYVKGKYTGSMTCIVSRSALANNRNFFFEDVEDSGFCVAYDPEYETFGDGVFDTRLVIPKVEVRAAQGYPLIFHALDYMNKPLGYVAYYFEGYDITDYSRSAYLTEMLNQGLGGYINMQYQKYLIGKVDDMYKKDALTGLYNRLAFRENFERIKSDPDMDGMPMLVIMADLDYLKKINDGLGHKAGDQAIASVAEALKSSCPENSLCVRFGGDEMLAFIPGGGDPEAIISMIGRRLEAKSREYGFTISASIGILNTVITKDMDFPDIVEEVDAKLYEVKKSRR
jgi:diguanylate cyclase (GGDEF)-like protein